MMESKIDIAKREYDRGNITRIDLIRFIAAYNKPNSKYYSKWSPKEDAMLKKMVLNGFLFDRIGKTIGRTREACIGRSLRLGLSHPYASGK